MKFFKAMRVEVNLGRPANHGRLLSLMSNKPKIMPGNYAARAKKVNLRAVTRGNSHFAERGCVPLQRNQPQRMR